MIDFSNAVLQTVSIHQVGNKTKGEALRLSEKPFSSKDARLLTILTGYFSSPFLKEQPTFQFYHPNGDLQLNEVYHYSNLAFEDAIQFHQQSIGISRHLYDIADHPNIKGGDVYVIYFKSVSFAGEIVDAIGIFKTETKDTFIKIIPNEKGFELIYEQDAVNVKKIDKGCLILNSDKKEGYNVFSIDQTNNTDTIYWIDKFLKLREKQNGFSQTKNLLDVYRTFIKSELENDMEVTTTDKADLLNRSISFLKNRDHFDIEEFSYEVIGVPEAIEKFKKFKSDYETEYDIKIQDDFLISDSVIKKQARLFKSVLKLDKNFHVYIHGNTDLIEKGFDRAKGKNYYKIYFDTEQ